MELPHCLVVPTTRALDPDEEEKLVQYFSNWGRKRLPPDLPYVGELHQQGLIYPLTAQAMKEMETLAADKGIVNDVALIMMMTKAELDDSSGAHPRCMLQYVKRMKVTGQEEIVALVDRAYQKVAESSD